MQLAVLLALAGAAAVAAQDIPAIQACVEEEIALSTARFNGSALCPAECAHCHSMTMTDCPEACRSASTFCGCGEVIFKAVSDSRVCCSRQTGVYALVCSFGYDQMLQVVGLFASGMCNGTAAKEAMTAPSLAEIMGSTLEKAVAGKMAGLLESGSTSATTYVHGHSQGAACVNLLESMEREQAEQLPADEMPDLHAAASQIAEGSSGVLGREMPGLKDKVHRAMVSAWTEEGPGMDAEKICEVVLRHHDSL